MYDSAALICTFCWNSTISYLQKSVQLKEQSLLLITTLKASLAQFYSELQLLLFGGGN